MLDFRAFVEDDEIMTAEATDEDPAEDITSSKEKIDIEMGNHFGEEKTISLPEILLNIEYGGIHADNLKHKVVERETATHSDNFVVPVGREVEESVATPTVAVGADAEEKCDDVKSQQTTASD